MTVKSDRAQPEIAFHRIVPEGQDQIVQPSFADLPKMLFRKRESQHGIPAERAYRRIPDESSLIERLRAQSPLSFELCADGQLRVFRLSEILHPDDAALRRELKPHRLPYTRGSRVIAAEGLASAALLSARDKPVAGIVGHVHRHGVHARRNEIGYIKREGNISAPVAAALSSVYINSRTVIRRAEMKDHPSAEMLCIKRKAPFVPHRIQEIGVLYPRQAAFGAEGNVYATEKAHPVRKQLSFPSVIIVVRLKLPFSVQIHPAFAHKLRLRVLRSKYHCFSPLCFCTFFTFSAE